MFISLKHNFLFVHVPKTAGTSIVDALLPYCDVQADEIYRHAELAAALCFVDSKKFATLRKICITRNPWDWLLSNYLMILKSPRTPYYEKVSRMEFADYPEYHFTQTAFQYENYVKCKHLSNDILIDRPLRFENLDEDWQKLCSELDIPSTTLGHVNESSSPPAHYSNFYTNELRKYVGEQMSWFIDFYDYSFEEVNEYNQVDCSSFLNDTINSWMLYDKCKNAKEFQESLSYIDEAIEIKSDIPEFYRIKAEKYNLNGMKQKAADTLKIALDLNPNNGRIKNFAKSLCVI